jgi:hypothetical protein
MLRIRLRFLTVAILAVVIASGGAGVSVRGSQEPAPQGGQPLAKRPVTATTQTPQPKVSTEATGQSATAALQARLRTQRLATRKAKAVSEIAKLTRELAELAVAEYEQVSYPRDLATIESEIQRAESDLTRAEDRLKRVERRERYFPDPQKVSEELALQKVRFALEQLRSKRKVLVDYTKSKTIKELRSEVEKAHSDELAKQAAWDVARTREIDLERQLRRATD